MPSIDGSEDMPISTDQTEIFIGQLGCLNMAEQYDKGMIMHYLQLPPSSKWSMPDTYLIGTIPIAFD